MTQAPRSQVLVASLLALVVGGLLGFAAGRNSPVAAPAPAPTEPAPKDDSPIVARVGDETVTRNELEERWKQLTPQEQGFHASRAKDESLASGRVHLLDEIVEELLLAREARRRGLDRRWDVRVALRGADDHIVSRPLLAKEVREAAIPRSELEAWYRENQEQLGTPARVQVREIIVTSGVTGPSDTTKDAAGARARADELRSRAAAGEDFVALAKSSSEAPSAQYGGLVGWIVAGRYAHDWEEKAMGLQPGQVSDVLEIPEGFAILKADAREEATIPPFEQAQDSIRARILADDVGALQRRYNIFVRDLRQKENVEVHPELVGQDASPSATPEAGVVGPSGASSAGSVPEPGR